MLADLDINHNAFAKWDKPDSLPSGGSIIKIARYFDVTTDYLLGLSDVPNPSVPISDVEYAALEKMKRLEGEDVRTLMRDIDRMIDAQSWRDRNKK
jgi:transcriptional regulator with XRE-family HTH domain